MTNRLANESSPYLLQHAHNPVDWYAWGEEAFEKARAEDKPVLVSIGYAACHWCHVMERESFENETVAALMNEQFVNIKVDREERPDVDHIYMDAVQAISGSGGWPLNVFLLPDGRPFYGGTYYPPVRAFNRASWTEVLQAVAQSYREKRDDLEKQAEGLTEHLQASNNIGFVSGAVDEAAFETAVANALKTADKEWGGFGRAPKFPQTFTLNFLLQYAFYHETELREEGFRPKQLNRDGPLAHVLLSLDKMRQGGLYDHIGGGFARYSTDTEWLAPHFEKMLYDNALLVSTYCDAYALTGNEDYRQVIDETLAFAERELLHPGGGFFSALDADSEGVEGKFYVWTKEEVEALLGDEAALFCDFFDITERGNWEGTNIPRTLVPLEQFATSNGLDAALVAKLLADGKAKLLAARSKRVRPQLDDKVLLNWNALMNTALSKAFAVTGNDSYREMAERNMQFLLSAFGTDDRLHHSWKDSNARHPSFLDDYAFLIAALLQLAEVTFDTAYINKAAALSEVVLNRYSEEGGALFFYTAKDQTDVLLRKKEVYDGATASGNSVMAQNLYRLSLLLDRTDWRQRAGDMVGAMGEAPAKYPTSFGVWLSLQYEMAKGSAELAVVGHNFRDVAAALHRNYLPHKIIMASSHSNDQYPLLRGRNAGSETHLFFCRNYACQKPVSTLNEALALLLGK